MSLVHNKSVLALLALSAASSVALADNHLGIDTTSGNPGDHTIIKAGYYAEESRFTISGGRLLENGAIAVYDISTQLVDSGVYNGWYSSNPLTLASDFFFSSGRLDGGDFKFELHAVSPLSGGPSVMAWGDYADEGAVEPFTPSALSDAAVRLGRSFNVGAGEHDELQGLAFSTPGLYDVTFVAWDSNGRYADSDPMTARFNVIPAPGPAVTLALGGLVGLRRGRRR